MTITLQEGKFYKTRDGRKFGPLEKYGRSGPDYPWTVGDGEFIYRANGTSYGGPPRDLVAEWVDEPCPAQETVEGPREFSTMFVYDDPERVLSNAPPDIKAEIADEAKRIVSGARRAAYGKPERNFERIAGFWTAYAKAKGWPIEFTAADVSPMMRLMKEARLAETPDHRDSFVDLVGYALTGAEVNRVGQ